LDGGLEIVHRLERALFQNNFEVLSLRQEQVAGSALPNLLSTLLNAGLIVIYAAKAISSQERATLKAVAGDYFQEVAEAHLLDVREIEIRILSIAETLRVKSECSNQEDANRHG